MSSTRVYVRLYSGTTQFETNDTVLELPPPPLKWKDVIAAMVAAVGKTSEYEEAETTFKVRLFLLPTEATGIAAELNARSLRFGVRENDRFVICLQGEDYQEPIEQQVVAKTEEIAGAEFFSAPGRSSVRPMTLSTPSSTSGNVQPSISPYANNQTAGQTSNAAPPSGSIGGLSKGGIGTGASPGGLVLPSGKKAKNKRYRSISGKMAAIKSLGDKGLISSEDRGHLKDLLLNSDSPQLQEALDTYNNTGDFQAVKDLLLKEIQTPSSKRNTGDWLSESFVNDIALNFDTSLPLQMTKTELMPVETINNTARYHPAPPTTTLAPPANTYGYHLTNHSTSMGVPSYPQSSSTAMNQYSQSGSLATSTGTNLPVNNGYNVGMSVSNGYDTFASQFYNPPAPDNVYSAPPQINLPLRDRSTYMKRGYESSPVQNMTGMTLLTDSSAASLHMGMSGYGVQQGYGVSQCSHPGGNVMYAGDQSQYNMNPYMVDGVYNQYQQQPQYGVPRYAYSSVQADVGYNYYAAGYGYGKAQLRAGPGGKWTTAPPMPSYPPPCSKKEKKEKIAKWLKKRESRNWSNKPSYPVRHSIAKNRKRGEDGRFITKVRLAEMAAEEAATAGMSRNSVELHEESPSPSVADEALMLMVS
uniref:CCT domain-containing protein n=1 Tax=Peronospora matthiolae TaxID=2874970 RepID=A0AAV1UFZ9_9STRA